MIEPLGLLLRFLRRRAAAPSGMLVRTEVIREVRGFEDAFRGMYEDQAFCAKVCLRRPVVTTAKSVYRYRQHPGSSSARADRSGEPDFGRTAFLQWLGGYLGREGNEELKVRDTLRRELWWARHPLLRGLTRRARRLSRKLTGFLLPAAPPAFGRRLGDGQAGEDSADIDQMAAGGLRLSRRSPGRRATGDDEAGAPGVRPCTALPSAGAFRSTRPDRCRNASGAADTPQGLARHGGR